MTREVVFYLFFLFFGDIIPFQPLVLLHGRLGRLNGCQWLLQTSQAWQAEKSYGFVENPTTKSLDCRKQYLESLSSCPQTRFFPLGNTVEIHLPSGCSIAMLHDYQSVRLHLITFVITVGCVVDSALSLVFRANCSISVFGFCQDETSWTGTSPACKVPALQQLMQDRNKASNGSTSCQQSRI